MSWPSLREAVLASSPSLGVVALVLAGALLAVLALASIMRRRADAFPLLVALALPFRVPIATEGRTVNLLVPLYLVVAAGTLAHLLPRLYRGEGRRLRGLEWLPLASVGLYALQAIYSSDPARAGENIAFFYVPFALLYMVLREVDWSGELLLRCLAVWVGLAVVFAGVGFVEYARKSLFLNPKVVAANQYDNYFRVNSLFFDPNIYGRFLALVMVAVMGVLMRSARREQVLAGGLVLAWLLGGLITSFSQSSIAALLLGLAVLGAWRWDVRRTVYVALALIVAAFAIVLAAPASLHFGLKGAGGSTSNATSGRTKLIEGGLELFAQRPLQGYGSGSFQKEVERHRRASVANATSASHTIPVTVAAEQGIVGLALYAALLAAAFAVLLGGAGRSPPACAHSGMPQRVPRIIVAACFAALVLHTWTYAAFLEDPLTWTLLALGAALARERPSRAASASAGERYAGSAAAPGGQ